ncbi:MAG: serine/threonine-protein kinase [Bacteroidota bacterium]
MNRSEKYWEKASELFELCQDQPEEKWEDTLKQYSKSDPRMLEDIRKLLRNKDIASIYFDSFRHRIETELASRTAQYEFKVGDQTEQFRILKIIFRSNNTDIYLATGRDGRFNHKRMAVKVIRSTSAGHSTNINFNKERRILSGLNHPNIVKLYDEGLTFKGRPYLLMEYIDGVPVDRFCEINEPGFFSRLRIFIQLCDAVQYIHDNFVIHNDIKPGNILVTEKGRVKLIDFGISELLAKGGNISPSKYNFAGTINYASPEQIKGGPTTKSSDIYQMGLVLNKLITGKHPSPFRYNRNEQEIAPGLSFITKLLRGKCKEQLSLTARKNFCKIMGKTMSENPENRYDSVGALKNDLRDLVDKY